MTQAKLHNYTTKINGKETILRLTESEANARGLTTKATRATAKTSNPANKARRAADKVARTEAATTEATEAATVKTKDQGAS